MLQTIMDPALWVGGGACLYVIAYQTARWWKERPPEDRPSFALNVRRPFAVFGECPKCRIFAAHHLLGEDPDADVPGSHPRTVQPVHKRQCIDTECAWAWVEVTGPSRMVTPVPPVQQTHHEPFGSITTMGSFGAYRRYSLNDHDLSRMSVYCGSPDDLKRDMEGISRWFGDLIAHTPRAADRILDGPGEIKLNRGGTLKVKRDGYSGAVYLVHEVTGSIVMVPTREVGW